MTVIKIIYIILLSNRLLYLFHHLITDENGYQAEEQAAGGIEGGIKEISCAQKLQILIHKSAESGEPAAEADGEKQLHVGTEHGTAVEETIKESDEQTAEDVDHHCGYRERGKYRSLYPF